MNKWSVEDELAIRNLYAACSFAADDYDADAYADCFTQHAVLKVENSKFFGELVASGGAPFANAQGEIVGSKNIHAFLSFLGQFKIPSLHIACNFLIKLLEGDVAETRAVNAAFINGSMEVYARYVDKVARCPDGRWRFSERREIFHYERATNSFGNE